MTQAKSTTRTIADPGGIVLVSCYDLGHQPLGLAVPAARLEQAGFAPDLIDIAVDRFDDSRFVGAHLIGVSAPMHTALRLAIPLSRRIRAVNPTAHICFYGVYAELHADDLIGDAADSCLGAEYETDLINLAHEIQGTQPAAMNGDLPLPARNALPDPARYARIDNGGQLDTVASVATTRGCKHKCLHCPLTPVYRGHFLAIPVDRVIADVGQLVEAGVRHISFADPDFLNGPTHARRVAERLYHDFPGMTFSYTAKISHLVRHRDLVERLQDLGCLFVVSAVESFNDSTLEILAKGHTRDDAIGVFTHFRGIGLTVRPSLMPFNPWDSIDDVIGLLHIIADQGLVEMVDPIQYAIRMLIPRGSALLTTRALTPFLDGFDRERLVYVWHHPDRRMDVLQQEIHRAVENALEEGASYEEIFSRVFELTDEAAGSGPRRLPALRARGSAVGPPRLTEPWFC